MQLDRRTFLVAAAAGATGRSFAQALPAPQDLQWRSAGGRPLPVLVRFPARPPGPQGWPVILYSHGLGGSRQGGSAWGEAWAQAGFVVVHLQHVGSDLDAVRAARNPRKVAGAQQLMERLHDVQAALDALAAQQQAGSGPWAQVRPRAVGMAGHSFGAHTTLGAAGQAYPGYRMDDPRLAAFVALSPTLPAGDAARALAQVTRPMLCITGTEDGDVLGNGATPQQRRATYDALPAGHKALLVLQGADHMTFGGGAGRERPFKRRGVDSARGESAHRETVAAVSTDWWRAWLEDDGAARERLQAPPGLGTGDTWTIG